MHTSLKSQENINMLDFEPQALSLHLVPEFTSDCHLKDEKQHRYTVCACSDSVLRSWSACLDIGVLMSVDAGGDWNKAC